MIVNLAVLVIAFVSLAVADIVSSAPAGECGDGIVQVPNADGLYERCDEGPGAVSGETVDTARCTKYCEQKMLGWAWSGTTDANFGWISLNCQNHTPYPCSIPYYAYVTTDSLPEIRGWAWASNIGWICFGQTCEDVTGYGSAVPPGGWTLAVDENDKSASPAIFGWGKILLFGDNGHISFSCLTTGNCPTVDYKTVLLRANFGAEERYTLKGFSWNYNTTQPFGVGWIEFSPEVTPPAPFLQTQYGDIYALGGLSGAEPPSNVYNATYRILANDTIENFYSAGGAGFVSPTAPAISFPTAATEFSNALGQIDVKSLTTEVPGSCSFSVCKNILGDMLVKVGLIKKITPEHTLDNAVYYYPTSAAIPQTGPLSSIQVAEFLNGTDVISGAGTIVIGGDLTIDEDIIYEPSAPTTKFRNLASAVWIIQGDLKISCDVKQLAGNFIVLGDGTECSDIPDQGVSHCGQIYSSYDNSSCANQLKVSGLMMGRKFFFKRQYQSMPNIEGSEVITNDGRLLVNTPPGLGDFAKALPNWQINPFSQ